MIVVKFYGIEDVIFFFDMCFGIVGRVGFVWWLLFGGLFFDVFFNLVLSVGFGLMMYELYLLVV